MAALPAAYLTNVQNALGGASSPGFAQLDAYAWSVLAPSVNYFPTCDEDGNCCQPFGYEDYEPGPVASWITWGSFTINPGNGCVAAYSETDIVQTTEGYSDTSTCEQGTVSIVNLSRSDCEEGLLSASVTITGMARQAGTYTFAASGSVIGGEEPTGTGEFVDSVPYNPVTCAPTINSVQVNYQGEVALLTSGIQ